MANRLNYGKRWGSGVSSARAGYDEQLDRWAREDHAKIYRIMQNLPLHRRELIGYENGRKNSARRLAVTADTKKERAEAEARMAEAVRECAEILKFHMDELIQCRKVGGQQSQVNQGAIHDTLFALRNKCGVTFDGDIEYDHRYSQIPRIDDPRRVEDDAKLKMHEQKRAREEHMRRVTDKLINRAKQNG
jgi:hypothetical protein